MSRALLKGRRILHRILEGEYITIGATDGKRTIASATDVFTLYLDPDFKRWGTDITGEISLLTPVELYQMKRNGSFDEMFTLLGRPLSELTLSQSQIVRFCEEHIELLARNDRNTFFFFEVNNAVYVAVVAIHEGRLEIELESSDSDYAWSSNAHGGHRVVIPEQRWNTAPQINDLQ